MAGEIHERGAFQAECLSSGSISFGRFEGESLSWEKRSSFKHNRYLEEVERYSTPGSVTEKKAYFEAHFKKKGLPHQNSSLSRSGNESHNNVCINEDHMNYVNENKDFGIDQMHFEELQNPGNDGVEFSWYDETPLTSGEREHDTIDGEGEDASSIPHILVPQTAIVEIALQTNNQDVEPVGNVKIEVASNFSSVKEASQIKEQKEISKDVQITDDLSEAKVSSKNAIVETGHSALSRKPQKSFKKGLEKTTGKQKTKLTMGVESVSTRTPRKHSTEEKHLPSVQGSAGTIKKVKKDGSLIAKSEKQMHSRPIPSQTMNSIKKTTKSEMNQVSGNITTKGKGESRSIEDGEKGLKYKKGATLHSISAKGDGATSQSVIRPKQVSTSSKEKLNAAGPDFRFQIGERTEKRKEIYMKVEEKLYAKETKKNEIKAKTREEMEAAMKQFRRSLNFKATPLPSFYRSSGQMVHGAKKGVAATAKSSPQHTSHANAGCKLRQDSSKRTCAR